MGKPPDYAMLVKEHELKILVPGSDLGMKNGDLVLNRRGGLAWQDPKFDALFQFVQGYRMNEPTIGFLFEQVLQAEAREEELVNELNAAAQKQAEDMVAGLPPSPHMVHSLSDERGAQSIGQDACAGSILVILNNLLKALQKDLAASDDLFNGVGELNHGKSFGHVVFAAANNFRHCDEWTEEWVRAKQFTGKKVKSVQVLAAVLGRTPEEYRFLSGNVCSEVLAVLSRKDYRQLTRKLFRFAKELSEQS